MSNMIATLFALIAAAGLDSLNVASGSAVTMGTSPLLLNRHTFNGTVAGTGLARHWVVLFCVDWLGSCEELRAPFRALAWRHEADLNEARLLAPEVRFAEVSCASDDKLLCNVQRIEDYPTVVHYRQGVRAAAWAGRSSVATAEARRLAEWLAEELGPKRDSEPEVPRSSPARPAAAADTMRLPFAVLAVASFIWMSGDELRRAWLAVRALLFSQEVQKPQTRRAAAPTMPQSRLQRCLPEAWREQRRPIVL